ncbi:hypothetical protein [Clavibacter phaseoli]|uniref:hypothetical protein n=1 Tax=Clavibacter phaseoli TaxID=1734031 RepID=UPI0011C23B97|nr:hypothetical protein [Clavibacter phaseoli]UKF32108.1 hypothetical protein FGD69_14145 [Clavibacter phaseoli]UKF38030.1 hypothetical protein FGI33_13525 [Clavibacter phaseoli]
MHPFNRSVPYDWVSLSFDFISAISWPTFAILALLILRLPLSALLSSIEEIDLWGAKGRTRKGNERAAELKASTADKKVTASSAFASPVDDHGDEDDELGGDDEVEGQSHESGARANITQPERPENGSEARAGRDLDTDDSGSLLEKAPTPGTPNEISRVEMLNFYERIVRERLRRSTYNTATTSARLGAEIVGSSYADLKQTLRVIHYLRFGIGSRGKIRSMQRMYADLKLPSGLEEDMLKARAFATDVHERKDVVDGVGAEAYIRTVDTLVGRLCEWARTSL